jgi:O-antigen/teichoic acid export membrane protein
MPELTAEPEVAAPEVAAAVTESPSPASVPGARHLVRSVLNFGLAQTGSWVAGAVLAVVLPRFLGDVRLGKLGFALALVSMCSVVSNLGISAFLTREVARTPARARELMVNALAVTVSLNLVSGAVALAALTLGGYDATTRQVVLVLVLGMVVGTTSDAIRGVLQGFHRMRTLAVAPMAINLVYAGGAVAVLARGGGLVPLAIAYVASQWVGLAVCLVDLLRRVPIAGRPHWRICRLLVVGGLPYFVGQAAMLVYGQIDTILLSLYSGDAVIGWYVAALRIIAAAQFLPTILMIVIFPMLSAARATPERFNRIAQQAMHLLLLVCLPLAAGVALLPDRAIHLLGYPSGFDHSIVPLLLLALGMPLIALDMVIVTALGAADRQRQWAVMGVAAAVLNVLANLFAIPFTRDALGNGAVGAAVVTTLTELFIMVTGICLLPRGVVVGATLERAVRCLAATAAMGAVVLPLRAAPLALPVLLGTVTYAGAALVLGAVSRAEVGLVLRHLPLRRAGSPE